VTGRPHPDSPVGVASARPAANSPGAVTPLFSAIRGLPILPKVILGLLGSFVAVAALLLWPAWRHNLDLSHGLFMPVVFLALLHESRTQGPQRWLNPGGATTLSLFALLAAGLTALVVAGLYAAALGWTHALVNFTLIFALCIFLGAGLVFFSTATFRLIPFNWAALVAIGLWLLSAPMPLGTYTRLTLTLQLWVSENVLRALHVLGVAAHRQGNIIELAGGTVGIEEACSGVRSLISCVFAALFFSASLVQRIPARILVILLAAPLALGMNFLRSLTLTLLANAGIDIGGAWHDITGYAVLGITAVLLGGLAMWLGRKPNSTAPVSKSSDLPAATAPSGAGISFAFTAGLIAAMALMIFFYWNGRPSLRDERPVPDLLAILPVDAPGWRTRTTDDLYQFASQLQTKHLAERIYTKGPADHPVEISVYLAYWRAGQASVSQVASHTPDACWPGAGWQAVPQTIVRESPVLSGRRLPPAEARLFKAGDFPQHVWFWHLFDGRPIAYESPYSPKALLEIAWRYGFRHDGDQLFVRVSSNVPWNEIADEHLLAEIFQGLQPLGL
jgi:exosortase